MSYSITAWNTHFMLILPRFWMSRLFYFLKHPFYACSFYNFRCHAYSTAWNIHLMLVLSTLLDVMINNYWKICHFCSRKTLRLEVPRTNRPDSPHVTDITKTALQRAVFEELWRKFIFYNFISAAQNPPPHACTAGRCSPPEGYLPRRYNRIPYR